MAALAFAFILLTMIAVRLVNFQQKYLINQNLFLYEYSDGSMRAQISRDCSHELLRIVKVGDCSQLQLHRQP